MQIPVTLISTFLLLLVSITSGSRTKEEEVISENITIKAISMRANHGEQELFFQAFGKKYQLELQPSTILSRDTKIFEADVSGDGKMKITEVDGLPEKELADGLYSVMNVPGTVFVKNQNNGVEVEGIVDDLYIKSIPDPMDIPLEGFRHHQHHHRAIKITRDVLPNDEEDDLLDDLFMRESNTEIPKEVVVEVFAVMDYKNSLRLNFDRRAITKFLAIEYGAVQRIYNVFKNPAIKFRLSKIYFNKHRSAEPYINKNLLNENNVHENCLYDFRDWVLDLEDLTSVDVAFLHMDYGIYNNVTQVESFGLATFGYACRTGAAMAQNEAPYHLGYLTVAHEIGHLLNAHHDGHLSSSDCTFSDGYLMGVDQYDSLKYVFSPCSFRSIRKFVLSENASCLRRSRRGFDSEIDKYPGEVMTNDHICRMKMGRRYYGRRWPSQIACSKPLYCCNGPYNNNCTWMGGVEIIEGTKCGFKKICHKGRCVDLDTARNRDMKYGSVMNWLLKILN